MYSFSIPDGGRMRLINRAMLIAMEQHPNWFYNDFKIDIAFGCPPNCIWNGNHLEIGSQYSVEQIQDLLDFYNFFGVKYCLTFTNSALCAGHLADDYANLVASLSEKTGGAVNVESVLMYEYVKKKFPNLNVIWSTFADYGQTLVERIKKINEISANEIVVLPYDFNNKQELTKFKSPNNLEILVCEHCIDDCPMRGQHYDLIDKMILNGEKDVSNTEQTGCLLDDRRDDSVRRMHFVGRKLLKAYNSIKINRFRISGRDNVEQSLAAYSYYFVIEEAREKFLNFIQSIYQEIMTVRGSFQKDVYYSSFFDSEKYEKFMNFMYFNGGPPR